MTRSPNVKPVGTTSHPHSYRVRRGAIGARTVWLTALIVAATLGIMAGTTPRAHAFAEDYCYAGAHDDNCTPLPADCPLHEPVPPTCLAQVVTTTVVSSRNPRGARSLIHTDSTYIMARAVGFDPSAAYWIAAYDEATDLGTFTPKFPDGTPVPDAAARTTRDISGLVRTNFPTGGLLIHFPVPMATGHPVDGLHPVTSARTEPVIAGLRRWALAGAGTSVPLCTGGLTLPSVNADYTSGNRCYTDTSGRSVPIVGLLSVMSTAAIPFATSTGAQVVSGSIRSGQFDSYIGPHGPEARAGIYVHSLADRISHHRCLDASGIRAPSTQFGGFVVDLNNPECDQGVHALRHAYETGVPFDSLDAPDRTTSAALPAVYDALVELARARGVLATTATNPETRDSVLDELTLALQVKDGPRRLGAVTAVGCRRGIPAFPGAACPKPAGQP
ncbi:hypothetical protein [Gordonia sp. NPDC003429]